MPEFYYSDCDTYNSDYGVPIDCRDHEEGTQIVEGQCHSGSAHDCHGDANQVACCSGHYQGCDITNCFQSRVGTVQIAMCVWLSQKI